MKWVLALLLAAEATLTGCSTMGMMTPWYNANSHHYKADARQRERFYRDNPYSLGEERAKADAHPIDSLLISDEPEQVQPSIRTWVNSQHNSAPAYHQTNTTHQMSTYERNLPTH